MIMRILFASSELYPLIKTGGLADVSFSLSMALQSLDHDVKIIVPFYRAIKQQIKDPRCLFNGKVFGYTGDISIFSIKINQNGIADDSSLISPQIEVLLVDVPELFDRNGGPYVDEKNSPWGDSAYRFTVFSRVVAMLGNDQTNLGWKPDVVHCNDWQTGLVIPLLHVLV